MDNSAFVASRKELVNLSGAQDQERPFCCERVLRWQACQLWSLLQTWTFSANSTSTKGLGGVTPICCG